MESRLSDSGVHCLLLDEAIELRRHDRATPLVFVTNLGQLAVRGYEAEALDFIVKPFSYGAFAIRMDRAMAVMARRAGRSLTLRAKDGLRIIAASDLVFIETNGHNLIYHLADGEKFEVRGSLAAATDELGGPPSYASLPAARSTWRTCAASTTWRSRSQAASTHGSAVPTAAAASTP